MDDITFLCWQPSWSHSNELMAVVFTQGYCWSECGLRADVKEHKYSTCVFVFTHRDKVTYQDVGLKRAMIIWLFLSSSAVMEQ